MNTCLPFITFLNVFHLHSKRAFLMKCTLFLTNKVCSVALIYNSTNRNSTKGAHNDNRKTKAFPSVKCSVYAENIVAGQQGLRHLHLHQGIQRECILDDIFSISDGVDLRCYRKQDALYGARFIRWGNVLRAYRYPHHGGYSPALRKAVPAEDVSGLLQACYPQVNINGVRRIRAPRFLRQVYACAE